MAADDFRTLITEKVLSAPQNLILLTTSQNRGSSESAWAKVRVRPVEIRGELMLQFAYWDGRQEISKNYVVGDEARAKLGELLQQPFGQFHLQMTDGDVHVRITRKGRALVSQGQPSRTRPQTELAHDHVKQQPLATDEDNVELLIALGLANKQGHIKGTMRDKHRQVNEFLRILDYFVGRGALAERESLSLLDCGCGSAYLTFAAYHFLARAKGRRVSVQGVDVNEQVIASSLALRDRLGWTDLDFCVSSIADWVPGQTPDIVLSLHACDLASDEAIAKGIEQGSSLILAAPCCQHELHHQLRQDVWRPVLRQGILRERLADILTDTFRAQILRIMGYRTRVVEFVGAEHTPKNVMIQAEKGLPLGDEGAIGAYQALKSYWGVTPALEGMVGASLTDLLYAVGDHLSDG